ncbi:MAG: type I secretion system permease/ATPase [Rhodospirillaceae bacterium]|nr:type I secretion system permease/ATPase [Rhodospirillaceae bacterium]MBT7760411.1 type I secretion system permease/ATPase [Rhodospirillaceae bacterium]
MGLFSFCENLLMLAVPLYMLQIYDRVLTSNSTSTLLSLTFVTVMALGALSILSLGRARVLSSASDWLDRRLSPGLFERAIQSRLKSGGYGTEALDDLGTVRSFVTSSGMSSFFDLPWTFVFIAVSYALHPTFGHMAVMAAFLLVAIALSGEWLSRTPVLMANQAGMIARRRLEATARNAEVIEAMGMMGPVQQKWAEFNNKKLELQAIAQRRSLVFSALSKFIRLAAQIMTLGVGAWLVLGSEATGGVMIAASIILARALGPIEQTIGSWRSVVGARGALQRLKAFALQHEYRPTAMPLPAPAGWVDVEQIVFRSSDNHSPPILKGVGFQLEPGESLAVIGPSGAGKTTLARLLVGAVPPFSGVVRLDSADTFSWDRSQIGDFVGYLPQDIELFSGSIAENIARMGEVNSDKVIEAANLAGVHDLILRLPKGYDTEIGPDGQYLSGGYRQRIALARALYGPPRLVVLDEPNSNLDGEGEAALAQALKALKNAGVTVVVITHKVNLVQNVDKILFLREGIVERFGKRQEVLANLMEKRKAAVAALEPAE